MVTGVSVMLLLVCQRGFSVFSAISSTLTEMLAFSNFCLLRLHLAVFPQPPQITKTGGLGEILVAQISAQFVLFVLQGL